LISDFRRDLNIEYVLLGISPGYYNLTPGKYPKEHTQFLRMFNENVQMVYFHETNAIKVKRRQVQVKLEKL